ncbi:MAG: PaaI family thioesterase [Bacteroidia bacterium]|nr:PaaI family thioesterase [Bacteroidia bacterium]
MQKHFSLLEDLYLCAPIQSLHPSTTISVEDRKATIQMPVNEKHLHAAKGMHGSVYFRLLDDAAFFAANSIELNYFVLTGSFNVKLLKPVTAGLLKSIGNIKEANDKKIIASSELFNEKGETIAKGEGIFIRSKVLLNSI